MVLPWVPVATAPPTVWSMNHGNAASVQPFGAAADLRLRLLECGMMLGMLR